MRYERAVEVAAVLDEVWALLTDLERWPDWTASTVQITRLDTGPVTVGSRAWVRQPKGRPLLWTVTDLEPHRSFSWTASSTGLGFTAGHLLRPTSGGVHAILSFELNGPMAWLVSLLVGSRIRRYVDQEADGLRQAAELRMRGEGARDRTTWPARRGAGRRPGRPNGAYEGEGR